MPASRFGELRSRTAGGRAVRERMRGVRDDRAWQQATHAAVDLPEDLGKMLAYQGYRAQCERNGCGHGAAADLRLKEISDRQTARMV